MKIRRIEGDHIALGLIAAFLIVIAGIELFHPANIIERAINKSIGEYSSRVTANTPWLEDDMYNMLERDSASVEAKFSSGSEGTDGIGADFSMDRNTAARNAQAKFNINYNGTAALGISTYTDGENVTLSVPVLYNKNFTFTLDRLSESIYQMMGIQYNPDETQDIFFSTDAGDNTYNVMYKNISRGIITSGKKAWTAASDYREFTKIPKQEINSLNCKGYEIKLTPEGTKVYLDTFGNELFENADFKAGIKASAQSAFNSNAMIYQLAGIESADKLAEYMIDQYKEMFNSITTNGQWGETTVQLFINGGRLIKGQVSTYTTIQEQQLDINATVDFNGSNKPTDSLSAHISADSQGLGLTFNFADSNNVEGDVYKTNKTIFIDNTSSTQSFSLNTTFDNATNAYTADVNVESDDTPVLTANATGKIEKNDGYIITADSIRVTDGEKEIFNGNANVDIKPLSNEIVPIQGETVDIFNLEEEEVLNIVQEMQKKLSEIMSKINS